MMLEGEAKKRVCPRSIRGAIAETAIPPATLNCIGSKCMAWRWMPGQVRWKNVVCSDPTATTEPARPADVPATWNWCPYDASDAEESPASWTEPDEEARARSLTGYCGLAGDPPTLERTVWMKDADRI